MKTLGTLTTPQGVKASARRAPRPVRERGDAGGLPRPGEAHDGLFRPGADGREPDDAVRDEVEGAALILLAADEVPNPVPALDGGYARLVNGVEQLAANARARVV